MNKVASKAHKQTLINICKEMMDTSAQIKDYNFRSYFLRRTSMDLEQFERQEESQMKDTLASNIEKQQTKLEQLQRIMTVQNMYYTMPSLIEMRIKEGKKEQ